MNRAPVLVSLLAASALLGGCGGPPDDAAPDSFCRQLAKVNGEKTWDKTQEQVARLGDVGTPDDISASARAGFETLIKQTADAKDRETLVAQVKKLGAKDRKQLDAFDSYITKTCAG